MLKKDELLRCVAAERDLPVLEALDLERPYLQRRCSTVASVLDLLPDGLEKQDDCGEDGRTAPTAPEYWEDAACAWEHRAAVNFNFFEQHDDNCHHRYQCRSYRMCTRSWSRAPRSYTSH